MRFKKIFDASKAPQPEAKESGKSSDGRKKRNDRNDRRGKEGHGRKDGGNRRNNNEGRNDHSSRRSTGAFAPELAAVETGKGGKGKSKKFFDHNKDKNEDRSRGDRHNKHGRHEGNGGGKNSRYFDENSLEKQTRHKI